MPFILAVVVALILLALIVSGIRGCAGCSKDDEANQQAKPAATQTTQEAGTTGTTDTTAETTQAGAQESPEAAQTAPTTPSAFSPASTIAFMHNELGHATIDEDYLANLLGVDLASMLISQAQTNSDARWIASHPDEYLEDGSIVQYKMLRLAAKEPQSIPFVRDWPTKYCADAPDYNESHTDESSNGVPRLYQWDKRWGYTEYSSTTFALTGCAPTSMAMVYQARTGDTSKSPYDMAVYAMDIGCGTEFNGTDGSLFTYGASGLGLNGTQIDTAGYAITQALQSGFIVVANVGPGDFTDSGHYFVITGLNPDGTVTINDPFSAVRSAQNWDPNLIAGQAMAIYAIA